MKALALVLVASLALADSPDAPLATVVKAGTTLEADAVCMPPTAAVTVAQRVAACEAERVELRKDVMPLWVPVLVGVLALGAGVGIGVAIPRR